MNTSVLQQSLDELLHHLRQDLIEPSGADARAQQRYEQLEAVRLRIGRALAADPGLAVRTADRVLPLLVLDTNLTSQLAFPLIAALGRRPVLAFLITRAGSGGSAARANACAAAYWVGVWRPNHRRDGIIAAVRQGTLAGDQARALLEHDAQHPCWRPEDRVDDLWPALWRAAAEAFVRCPEEQPRLRLQCAFPLEPDRYPAADAPLLARVRAVAEAQPELYRRLLAGSSGYGLPG
ncbi:hypothetical protein ACFW1A_10320 [Kitasatospora sp. NPDC058965]|uniref:hypothetical protein n=1 Tax=Kitasatospora sp. NPDC058965 TaxID=3346682 RepID=UPI00368BA8F0